MFHALVFLFLAHIKAVAPGTPDATVQVVVRAAAAGKPGPTVDAYVALIPANHPATEPYRETFAKNGTAQLILPPGEYFLLVAADGYHNDFRVVHVHSGAGVLSSGLVPATVLSGTVTGADGKPVARARVRHAGAAPPPSRRDLSEMASGKLGAKRQTLADAGGAWQLPLYAREDYLLVEAPDYAPAWIVPDPAQAKKPLGVVLQKGASLEVALDRTDPALLVSVVPVKQPATPAIPVSWQRRVWARQAASEKLEWSSLPAGEYRIVAEHSDPLRFMTPVEVGRVTLRAGSTAAASVELPVDVPPQATAYASLMAEGAPDLEGLQAWLRRGNSVESVPAASVEAVGGSVIYAKTSANPGDVYVLTDRRVIAPIPRGHVESADGLPADTYVFYRGAGKLKVGVREGSTLPASANAKYSRCAGNDQRIVLPVTVGRDGRMAMPLLVGCHSLTLHFDGYAPLAFAPAARVGAEQGLGEHVLAAPATAEIRVVSEPGGIPAPEAMVRAMVSPDRRQSIVVAEGRADREGRLVMNNLPGGQEVRFEARDAATQRTGIIDRRIDGAERVTIDPLTIPAPAALTVVPRLDPGFAADVPDAKIEAVVVKRRGGTREERRDASLANSDTAVFDDLSEGTWYVVAVVAIDGGGQPIEAGVVELRPGEQQRVTPVVKPLLFKGLLTANGKGVQASLGIGDAPGPNAIRRRVHSGPDGTFSVTLPRAGVYRVDARRSTPFMLPEAQRVAGTDRLIDIGPVRFDEGTPLVEIELPAGSVAVRLRNGEEPVPEGEVVATLRSENAGAAGVAPVIRRVKTDAAGETALLDLTEGTWIVEGRDPRSGRSAAKTAVVRRSGQTEVTLNIEPADALEGRVVDGNGASVAGARVDCMFLGTGDIPREVFAETTLDGRFSIPLAKPAPSVLYCGAATTGGAVEPFVARQGAFASVTLSPASSSLTIADWGTAISANRYWLVSGGGQLFNLTWAARKFGRPWSALDIPRLPAGNWKVVRVDNSPAWSALGRGVVGSLPPLASVRLDAGDHQEITIHQALAAENRSQKEIR